METLGIVFGHLVKPDIQKSTEYSPADKDRVWRIVWGLRREDRKLESASEEENAIAEKSVEKNPTKINDVLCNNYIMSSNVKK